MISPEYQKRINADLKQVEESGRWGLRRIIATPTGPRAKLDSQDTIIITNNNYLNLSNDQELVAEAIAAMRKYGGGQAAGPRICGLTDLHVAFEEYLAQFHSMERCLLFNSCYYANVATLPALSQKGDLIFSDAYNHASIVDGCRLSGAKVEVYPHLDLSYVEQRLREDGSNYQARVLVTDGVFSMDGDLAPLPQLIELTNKYEVVLVVDDSHGTGVMGKTGKGTAEYFGVEDKIDVIISTLGKAMGGSIGGYVAANAQIIEHIVQNSRYRFTNVVPTTSTAFAFAAFRYLEKHPELPAKLHQAAGYFKEQLRKEGFIVPESQAPIVPLIVGDAQKAMNMSELLFDEGVFVQGYTYPAVPKGLERLRFIISVGHTPEIVDEVVAACVKVGKQLQII